MNDRSESDTLNISSINLDGGGVFIKFSHIPEVWKLTLNKHAIQNRIRAFQKTYAPVFEGLDIL